MENFIPEGPLMVGWDITRMCNLRCKHCYASAGKRHPREFSFNKIKDTVDELDELGTVMIAIAGGEPFMRKDLADIVSYIKGKGIEVFLNTNGTLITKDRIERLINVGLRHIEISIDGLEEDHDFIRGEGTFKAALRGFEICKEMGLEVGIMSTLFKHNFHKVSELIDFFYNKRAVGVGFLRFITSGRGKQNRDLCLEPEERKKAIEDVYRKRMQYGEKFYLKIETPLSYLVAKEYPELLNKHQYLNIVDRSCDGGITSCQILYDGTVTFCPQMNMGNYNLYNHNMRFIWKNDKYFNELRTRKVKGKCSRCEYGRKCGGCRIEAFLKTGDILEEDPGCWYEC